ncbi:MAG: thermonuclease family protein [Rhodospirillales bacterium]|jgi:endonuclease YncB( thermonuclease family)|nr:thermonuclease family protein [Rhodospirillales bacterium]MDP6644500.1 thermonuclease family protein [Rhodospirillales bacterium]MDP6840227.1 thermonuclease family protein [Rhodospirillales bacterium]|tara:strand:+ start:428 stop:871 length:444 start_codon:yes stop_codon:yes gene_type:complete
MIRVLAFILPLMATALVSSPLPQSAETLAGPVTARLLRVIDGDTIAVSARIWLGQRVETLVRLDGADAPELRGKCAGERQLAKRAKDFVAAFLGNGAVILRDIQYGKFAGRVVSRIFALDGRDLAEALIARGLAHSYAGGRRRNWCV